MNTGSKYNLLKYIPEILEEENNPYPERVFNVNNKPILNGNIVYLMSRELRVNDNFGLNYALVQSKKLNRALKIIHIKQFFKTKLKQQFYETQLNELKNNLNDFNFEIKDSYDFKNTGLLIIDFNPICNLSLFRDLDCKIVEIDSHNIIPARYISDKQEYNAHTFRRKVYKNINDFLTKSSQIKNTKTNADLQLEYFIKNNLDNYAEYKNRTDKNVTSRLSKYLTCGFISSRKITLEILNTNTSEINKEAFLEELIIRKELADNFCLYCKNFKKYDCIPKWAKESLIMHQDDFRQFLYTEREFENGQTRDKLWNRIQNEFTNTGYMHGYSRMYWAKKILEWSETPEKALKTAIYLNDKYALDAPSPNGYTGILWSMGGLHDRPFRNRPITGKIRPMNGKNIKY